MRAAMPCAECEGAGEWQTLAYSRKSVFHDLVGLVRLLQEFVRHFHPPPPAPCGTSLHTLPGAALWQDLADLLRLDVSLHMWNVKRTKCGLDLFRLEINTLEVKCCAVLC